MTKKADAAQASVLEPFLGKSRYPQHGQRVVEGQRMMQAAPDVMLGWERIVTIDGEKRDFLHPATLGLQGLAIGLVLGLSLVVLLDLTYPFSGDLSVSSAPFRTGALAQFFARSR